jgi:hypothetical protein
MPTQDLTPVFKLQQNTTATERNPPNALNHKERLAIFEALAVAFRTSHVFRDSSWTAWRFRMKALRFETSETCNPTTQQHTPQYLNTMRQCPNQCSKWVPLWHTPHAWVTVTSCRPLTAPAPQWSPNTRNTCTPPPPPSFSADDTLLFTSDSDVESWSTGSGEGGGSSGVLFTHVLS